MGYGRLTEKKVRYIVRHKRRGKSNREIPPTNTCLKKDWQREHSMSAAYIDWFERDGIKFCAILDDASRKILAAGEFKNANTENSINPLQNVTIQQAFVGFLYH